MATYRSFFFETSKLAASKEFDDKATAETATQFGLRWGSFDRAEIWTDHKKLVAWVRDGEELLDTV
jgi:hypothetical protein